MFVRACEDGETPPIVGKLVYLGCSFVLSRGFSWYALKLLCRDCSAFTLVHSVQQ